MKNFLLDLFFPKHCLGCAKEGEYLCPVCLEKIPLNQNCPEKLGGIKLLAASFYDYPLLKRAIHKYKYEFVRELAKPLAQLMAEKIRRMEIGQNLVLTPAPLHPRRLRWRGFNQAELLAQAVSQQLNLPLVNNLLIRTRHNPPQAKIKTSQNRKENIKGAFALNPAFSSCHCEERSDEAISNKTVILIDDVSASGATLQECAQALKPLKPKDIWGLVLAKG